MYGTKPPRYSEKCKVATEQQMQCIAFYYVSKGECPPGAVCTNRLETGD